MLEKKWMHTVWPEIEPQLPEMPTRPIFEEIRNQAVLKPDKTAINFYGHEISFKMLDILSDRFANSLAQLGVSKGDRVGIYLENCPQFIIAFYGILKIGGVVVTCSPMYKAEELEYELKNAGILVLIMEDFFYSVLNAVSKETIPPHVIVTSFVDFLPKTPSIPLHDTMSKEKQFIEGTIDFMDLVREGRDRPAPPVDIDLDNDLALLQYTAGTTGFPKGAMLTHGNLAVHGRIVRHYYEYEDNDVHLVVLPIFHVTGLDIATNPALAQGSTVILFARFDLGAMLGAIADFKVTHMITIAPINIAMINYPGLDAHDLSSLRLVLSGGAAVPEQVHKKWRDLTGIPLSEGYGLSECTGGIIGNNRRHLKVGTVGAPVYFHNIRLVDPDTRRDAPGEHGELWIKGPCVMKGYWKAEKQTREMLTHDGWLKTGDIARVDGDGWVSIAGRIKEMIKVSGYSVFLEEIDTILIQHPAVAEVATIGVPHPLRGEEAKSFVVLADGANGSVSKEDIIGYCKGKMAAYKYPRQIEFIDELPKSGAGKVLRRVLAEKFRH